MKLCYFHPEALREIDHAAAYYKDKQAGLETRFLEIVEDAALRIQRNPLMYKRIEGELRKCRLPHFPYGLVFRIQAEQIEIIALMHLRQQPGYWQQGRLD